jgi:predicted branched-subunit amino acid permease
MAGRLLGAAVSDPAAYGLDFAFTAVFLALLFSMWRGRGDLVPWIVGALVAIVVARLVPGQWYVIAGGIAGSLAGAVAETWRARNVR